MSACVFRYLAMGDMEACRQQLQTEQQQASAPLPAPSPPIAANVAATSGRSRSTAQDAAGSAGGCPSPTSPLSAMLPLVAAMDVVRLYQSWLEPNALFPTTGATGGSGGGAAAAGPAKAAVRGGASSTPAATWRFSISAVGALRVAAEAALQRCRVPPAELQTWSLLVSVLGHIPASLERCLQPGGAASTSTGPSPQPNAPKGLLLSAWGATVQAPAWCGHAFLSHLRDHPPASGSALAFAAELPRVVCRGMLLVADCLAALVERPCVFTAIHAVFQLRRLLQGYAAFLEGLAPLPADVTSVNSSMHGPDSPVLRSATGSSLEGRHGPASAAAAVGSVRCHTPFILLLERILSGVQHVLSTSFGHIIGPVGLPASAAVPLLDPTHAPPHPLSPTPAHRLSLSIPSNPLRRLPSDINADATPTAAPPPPQPAPGLFKKLLHRQAAPAGPDVPPPLCDPLTELTADERNGVACVGIVVQPLLSAASAPVLNWSGGFFRAGGEVVAADHGCQPSGGIADYVWCQLYPAPAGADAAATSPKAKGKEGSAHPHAMAMLAATMFRCVDPREAQKASSEDWDAAGGLLFFSACGSSFATSPYILAVRCVSQRDSSGAGTGGGGQASIGAGASMRENERIARAHLDEIGLSIRPLLPRILSFYQMAPHATSLFSFSK